MSRAYRVRVSETIRRTIKGEDHVGACLGLLEILPPEEMAALLREELKGRGFTERNGQLVRRGENGLTITVDSVEGTVEVRSESEQEVEVSAERTGHADSDWGKAGRARVEEALREELRGDLENRANARSAEAQAKATEQLEAGLLDLRGELDQVVNRVTAEALKRKAAMLGRIKEMTEDVEAGSVTIVLEV
jgi:hypothetical protein